ncbi:hypothetical protein GCM10009117_17220 [Gangjinia marincola]|uniref:DUF4199 domain-containing protein n=1 Tax=Gangjinia marincola TaxID=578463 RepID=A0ABN1MHC1_9FLAO
MKNITLPIRFALAITGSLIGYFLILALFGLHTNPFFSLFNGVISGFGIYEAIKYYKLHLGDKFEYSDGFRVGVITGFVATILFTIFFGLYSSSVEPDFVEELLTSFKLSYSTGLGIVLFVVAIMGFATSLVLTLSFMQLFKDSWNTKRAKNKVS